MTKDQAAKKAGCKNYDCAVPQDWIDRTASSIANKLYIAYDVVYVTLLSGVVWCYDDSLFGLPKAVTAEAKAYQDHF